MLGALDGVTRQPVLQIRDMGLALASVVWNEGSEFVTGENPMWFPEMKSDISLASANGTSQAKLLLSSNFVTGTGVFTYDLTTAMLNGRWGDVSEMAGGVAGGFFLGKVTSKYGDHSIELNTGKGIELYSNPIPIKLVAPKSEKKPLAGYKTLSNGIVQVETREAFRLLSNNPVPNTIYEYNDFLNRQWKSGGAKPIYKLLW